MKIKILTYNINNNKQALKDIFNYINSFTTYTLLISIQECYSSFKVKTSFKYTYHKKMYGIHSIILSDTNFDVKFYCYCLGSFYLGNKGYILATINNLVFGCVHLIHGENKKFEREKQIKEIIYKLTKKNVILSGDFNFRRKLNDSGIENNVIVNESDFSKLDKHKECNIKLKNSKNEYNTMNNYKFSNDQYDDIKVMTHYNEAKINFPVTYKYNKSYINKIRIPSYCDRIIYKLDLPCKIIEYNSLHVFTNSDHKPVFLDTEVDFLKGNNELKTDILSEISTFLFENWFISLIFIIILFFVLKKLCF